MDYNAATDNKVAYDAGGSLVYVLIAGALAIFIVDTIMNWRSSKLISKILAITAVLLLFVMSMTNPIGSGIGIVVGVVVALIKNKSKAKRHTIIQ